MSYSPDGHVEPGQPSISKTVTLPDGVEVEVRKFSVSDMNNNVYVLVSEGQSLLIDAADDAPRILQEVEGLDVVAIMTTHGHWDHVRALDAVAEATGATVCLHADDQSMVGRPADRHVDDGDVIEFGAASVRLIHNPGHTPGSTSILLGDTHLFTGDTLFPGGPGGTFGDADAFAQIMDSLEQRLFTLPDETRVHPGHGDDTTLGAERPSIPQWRVRGW